MDRLLPGTRALRTFDAAARHLNFTRATAELSLTPAAVSYQIKEIEDQLGLVLFTRTSRSIALTPAGAIFFEATSDALASLHRAVGRARRQVRGTAQLRVSLGARFATNWLMPRLPSFQAANPGLDLSLDITDALCDFDIDDVDVAIRFGAGDYPRTRSDRLFDSVVVPVCSPALLAAGTAITNPKDLLTHTLCYVDCKVDGMTWPNWAMWLAAAGVPDFDDRRCMAFTESSHVVQAVIEGGAVGLVELPMVARELAQGRLLRLFDVSIGMATGYAYYLVYPENAGKDPRILAFRRWMSGELSLHHDATQVRTVEMDVDE